MKFCYNASYGRGIHDKGRVSGVPQDLQIVPGEVGERRAPQDQARSEGALPEGRRRPLARAEGPGEKVEGLLP